MKKITFYIDEAYGEEIIVGFVGKKGKNISAKAIVLNRENEYKVRVDGEISNLLEEPEEVH